MSTALINGDVSFWWNSIGREPPRPPLPGSTQADVCIIGAGYTGLWTAYYLKKAAPQLRVVVLEQRFAGFGASGRNGGWLTNDITGGRGSYLKSHGREAVGRQQTAMNETVDEVIRVTRDENIDCDLVKGGEFTVATNAAQQARLLHAVDEAHSWPMTDVELLERGRGDGADQRARHDGRDVAPALRATASGEARRADWPASSSRWASRSTKQTRVTEIRPHEAVTAFGTVTADTIVRATEGFTAQIDGLRRTWLPMNSSLIVTEPLSAETWAEIGWSGYETLGDQAHAYMYAQRTADDRIAIGGRGAPYRYGSGTDVDGATDPKTVGLLRDILIRFFPSTARAAVEHVWSGVLGVPRDWSATVGLDPSTGLGWAGGYVGTGVTSTNLAGRTLRDLILKSPSALTELPWVNHRVRKWEPEPLRYIAVQAMYKAYYAADRAELRGRATTSPIATAADLVSGRGH